MRSMAAARTCLVCSHGEREAIDSALATGEPLRNIAKRVSMSPAGLIRHKSHVAQTIIKASEKRGEQLGDCLLDEMGRVQRKAGELLARTESDGHLRGSIVALRMQAQPDAANAGPEQIKITFIDASLCPECGFQWNERNEKDRP
jgi:hypothetical protein